jgi:hypothetical protein
MRKVTIFAQHDMWVDAEDDKSAIDLALTFLWYIDPRWSHNVQVMDFPEPCVVDRDAPHPFVVMHEETEKIRAKLGMEPLGWNRYDDVFARGISERTLIGDTAIWEIESKAQYYAARLAAIRSELFAATHEQAREDTEVQRRFVAKIREYLDVTEENCVSPGDCT